MNKTLDMNKFVELIKFVKTISTDMKEQLDIYDKQETLDRMTNDEIEHICSLEDSLNLLDSVKTYLKDINEMLYNHVELGDTSEYIKSESN